MEKPIGIAMRVSFALAAVGGAAFLTSLLAARGQPFLMQIFSFVVFWVCIFGTLWRAADGLKGDDR